MDLAQFLWTFQFASNHCMGKGKEQWLWEKVFVNCEDLGKMDRRM